jgi:hypothetical protein
VLLYVSRQQNAWPARPGNQRDDIVLAGGIYWLERKPPLAHLLEIQVLVSEWPASFSAAFARLSASCSRLLDGDGGVALAAAWLGGRLGQRFLMTLLR